MYQKTASLQAVRRPEGRGAKKRRGECPCAACTVVAQRLTAGAPCAARRRSARPKGGGRRPLRRARAIRRTRAARPRRRGAPRRRPASPRQGRGAGARARSCAATTPAARAPTGARPDRPLGRSRQASSTEARPPPTPRGDSASGGRARPRRPRRCPSSRG